MGTRNSDSSKVIYFVIVQYKNSLSVSPSITKIKGAIVRSQILQSPY